MPTRRKAPAAPPAARPSPQETDEQSPQLDAVPVPQFSSPARAPRLQDPTPEGTTTRPTTAADSAGADDAATPENGSTASTDPDAKRLPGNAGKSLQLDKEAAAAFATIAGAVVLAVGGVLNSRFAVVEGSGEWLPDDQDQAAIGEPLGRIAARHASLPGGGEVTDIADAITAAVGVVMYGVKNLQLRTRLRAMRRREADIQPPPPDDDVPTEQAPPPAVLHSLAPPR
jgi:hypothetical protein